jgi:hypothetical protein
MDFNTFLNSPAVLKSSRDLLEPGSENSIDLSRASEITVDREMYLEAESRGMSLTELLEADEYDPTPPDAPLDAFERQLALAGVRLSGKNPTTVEQFYQNASALMPEFILREIKNGMAMRPEISKIVANTTTVANNRYTPFHIDTSSTDNLSLRPIGEGAEIPHLLVTEQNHSINVPEYGLGLKASYKALRYRTTAQFRVLLWYIGFKLQTDKLGLIVDCIINGDGNSNAAGVVNTAVSGTLDYDDLITLWSQFSPFEMNTLVCGVTNLKTIMTLDEFKDPMAGYRFQNQGELFSPLGATLIRCDDIASDLVIGLDSRFAVEEVITQPLMVEYDKIIDQRFEEAVISEAVAYAKVIDSSSVVLDVVHT